jgi:hypothetical protein
MPTIPNLCGASPELDEALTKLEELENDLTAKIDAVASEAAAVAEAAVTELKAAFDGLAVDLPEVPPLNLQAEITSLLALPKTTPGEVLAYTSKLSNIETNFGTELTSAGKSLTTLVTDATTAISGDGDLCAAVPNFEKAADGSAPAVEKAAAVLQAAVPPLAEKLSEIVENPNVAAKVVELREKLEKNIQPGADGGFEVFGDLAADYNDSDSVNNEVAEKSKEITIVKEGIATTTKVVTAKESVVRTTLAEAESTTTTTESVTTTTSTKSEDVTKTAPSSKKTVADGGSKTTYAKKATIAKDGFTAQPKTVEEFIKDKPDAFGNGLLDFSDAEEDFITLSHKPIKVIDVKAFYSGAGKRMPVRIYSSESLNETSRSAWAIDPAIGPNNIRILKNGRTYGKYILGTNGKSKRFQDVVYIVEYQYLDTYNPNVKKATTSTGEPIETKSPALKAKEDKAAAELAELNALCVSDANIERGVSVQRHQSGMKMVTVLVATPAYYGNLMSLGTTISSAYGNVSKKAAKKALT